MRPCFAWRGMSEFMIVSHRHRFIFLKTKKTAGSSLEYALADLCGDEDIITPASRDEEPVRRGRKAQNFWLPAHQRSPINVVRAVFSEHPERYIGFYNHMPAQRVKALLGDEMWSSYFKFAFERNPWDRQVSLYFWRFPDPDTRPGFEAFLTERRYIRKARNWSIYTINDQLAVDRIGRYESLEDDLKAICDDLGAGTPGPLPKLKTGTREGGRGYRQYYTDQTRAIVADWYQKEIEAFGYEF